VGSGKKAELENHASEAFFRNVVKDAFFESRGIVICIGIGMGMGMGIE
jgi:hypothetical protein